MIRKTLVLLACMAIAVPTIALAEDQKPISVFVDGQPIKFEVPPVIENGSTLVPIRAIFEKLGIKVTWDGNTQTINGTKEGLNIQMQIGNINAVVNGKVITLEVPPNIINGSTFVPLRFVGESADSDVRWNEKTRGINVSTTLQEKILYAVVSNDVNRVKDLLEKGANPNERNQLGQTLFQQAIINGHVDIVKVLIDANADLNLKDSFGKTPLQSAREYNNSPGLGVEDKQVYKKIIALLEEAQGNSPIQQTQTYGELNANGIKYVGDLLNGVPNGKGVYIMEDGSKYEGEVKDNKPSGIGRFTMADGTYYEGQIINGVFEGQGKFVFADKSKYVGEVKNGKPNGLGVMYTSSGDIFQQGEFKDGILVRSTNTTSPTSNITNSTSVVSSGNLVTKGDLQKFLESNFGELNTSLGKTKFTFDIYENTSIISAYDYWIMVKYDSSFFYDVKYSNKISADVRTKVKQELKDHQERLGRAVVQAMPNKKFDGGYYDSWYRYPNLRVDLITRHYFSWNNYDGTVISGYEKTKPSSFRWQPLIDDDF